MKILVDRQLIEHACDCLRDAEIYVNTCSDEKRFLVKDTYLSLIDILKANPVVDAFKLNDDGWTWKKVEVAGEGVTPRMVNIDPPISVKELIGQLEELKNDADKIRKEREVDESYYRGISDGITWSLVRVKKLKSTPTDNRAAHASLDDDPDIKEIRNELERIIKVKTPPPDPRCDGCKYQHPYKENLFIDEPFERVLCRRNLNGPFLRDGKYVYFEEGHGLMICSVYKWDNGLIAMIKPPICAEDEKVEPGCLIKGDEHGRIHVVGENVSPKAVWSDWSDNLAEYGPDGELVTKDVAKFVNEKLGDESEYTKAYKITEVVNRQAILEILEMFMNYSNSPTLIAIKAARLRESLINNNGESV